MPRAKVSRSKSPKALSSTLSIVSKETTTNLTPAAIEDEIRLRAYELYEQRGRLPGFENDDWLEAERQVLGRPQSAQSA